MESTGDGTGSPGDKGDMMGALKGRGVLLLGVDTMATTSKRETVISQHSVPKKPAGLKRSILYSCLSDEPSKHHHSVTSTVSQHRGHEM